MKKNISKAKAFQIVVDNMRTLCYEQTIEHRTSLSRIAGLIGLCELVLIWKGSHHRLPIHLEYSGFTP